ncbi:TonB-dependent receptor [Formosa sp. PL04]|uniref:SusC/RagA family TonB-linked outer membrane protein n=1 Tax=Formosa sp. PL04 TaxID=3081755 RepID=UPI0029829BA8|nr:TonB-dependent receptor [Formosa sp. PL04]MDW5290149.1 TonB-dependent receptor [Formosa sp. PL04]
MKQKTTLWKFLSYELIDFKLKTSIALLLMYIMVGSTVVNASVVMDYKLDSNVQDPKVTGSIVDQTGMPMGGVNVLVAGTSRGALSDFDGNYEISAQKGEVLTFSYVGMKSISVTVGSESTVNVKMEEDQSQLDEVVIVGYGTQKKSDLTGAISTLSGKGLDKLQVSDASQLLLGRMTGVNVEAVGGSPGANTNIVIRGVSSLSNSNPLFVIDGMFTDNMDFLNPSDIKSIEVLKDASAAAIFGSRAANGVIIISTNNGSGVDGVYVDIETSYGMQSQIKGLDWLTGAEYANLRNELTIADTPEGQQPNFLPGFNEDLDPSVNTIIEDIAISDAPVKNVGAKVYGSSGVVNYNISANWFDQEGIIIASDFDRKTFRANMGLEKGKLKINESLTLSNTYRTINSIWNLGNNILPTIPLYNPDNDGGFGGATEELFDYDGNNHIGRALLQDRHQTKDNLLGNLSVSYEFFEGFNANVNMGLQVSNTLDYTFMPTFYISDAINAFANNAELIENTTDYVSQLIEGTISYKKSIEEHSFDLLAGATSLKDQTDQDVTWVSGFPSNDIRQISAASTIVQVQGTETISTLQSLFGRVNYNYASKYFLSATIRRDGSSRFSEENRYGTFPSISGAWTLSKENFLADNNVVNNLKLRGSYGELGSQNILDYAYIPTLNINSDAVFGTGQNRVPGVSQTVFANPNLVWETTKTYDIGLDLTMFDYKFTLTADYFNKVSENILVSLRIPPSSGTNTPVAQNAASIKNTGLELMGTYSDQIGDLSFDISANVTFLNNEVLSLGENIAPITAGTGSTENQTRTAAGDEVASYYGYNVIGIYQTEEEIANSTNADPNAQPGDFIYEDLDNSGALTTDDQKVLGSYIPEFQYGFTINANYKNWDINMIFNGVHGNEIYNQGKGRNLLELTSNMTREALDYWTPENRDASLPRIGGGANNARPSSFYVESGAYFRLRNIQIGYTLPEELLEKIKVRKIRFYASAQNLFTITNYSGYYPEIGRSQDNELLVVDNNNLLFYSGVDQSAYPPSRTIIMGLQFGF